MHSLDDSKDISNVLFLFLNEWHSFERSINQRMLNRNLSQFPQKYYTVKTVFNIENNQKCDTEDWSNGCWKFSFASQE